jgi:phage terminase Nu1 subunit (DNA packaging protein)
MQIPVPNYAMASGRALCNVRLRDCRNGEAHECLDALARCDRISGMDNEISGTALMKLLGIRKSVLAELVEKGIVTKGKGRGTYKLESVTRYCAHLRGEAAARGGQAASEARARLGQAQATLAEAKAKQLSGDLAEVETFWRSKLKVFRNRVLAIPHRVEYLSARQRVTLTQELRACLDELADDKAA